MSPQGSFRYGTVIRPLVATAEYDIDNVTSLTMAKTAMTQKQLKELYGGEVKGYAAANGMLAPVVEKRRCWRLLYADEIGFHLDTVPCVPEEPDVIRAIVSRGVPPQLAALAVAITDRRRPEYDQISRALLSSNPRGFARWFEGRARPYAAARMRQLVDRGVYGSVEDVPPYEWRTPLQGSIQLLKRHRDVMFRDDPSAGPISMIITNLAAHAYTGEEDLWSALRNIVEKMPQHVRPTRPLVPNPADPAEDYADKWAKKPALEENFWAWHAQVTTDIARLPVLLTDKGLSRHVYAVFAVDLTEDDVKRVTACNVPAMSVTVGAAPVLHVPSPPRPWGEHG